jgi:hypothetical protein
VYLSEQPVLHDDAPLNENAAHAARIMGSLKQPHPSRSPRDVVTEQLASLGDPDLVRGVLQCMAFASPANQAATGPLPRFGAIITSPPYDVLGKADGIAVGDPTFTDDTARIFVAVMLEDQLSTFVWVLSKQTNEPYRDCWMTDSVLRVESQRDETRPRSSTPSNEETLDELEA